MSDPLDTYYSAGRIPADIMRKLSLHDMRRIAAPLLEDIARLTRELEEARRERDAARAELAAKREMVEAALLEVEAERGYYVATNVMRVLLDRLRRERAGEGRGDG